MYFGLWQVCESINKYKYCQIYIKPYDSGLVFRIPANKVRLVKRNNDNKIFTKLPYSDNYYEFNNDAKGDLHQVVNKNGEIIFKSYCTD